MARTRFNSLQVKTGGIGKDNLNTDTTGKAVATRLISGNGTRLESTGVDSGTGDVTIHSDGPVADREISAAADTPAASDVGLLLITTSNSAVTLTLNGAGFSDMSSFTVLQDGNGQITFSADTGNEIIGVGPFRSAGQGAGLAVMYLGSNRWWVSGDLENSSYSLPTPLSSIAGLTTAANQGLYLTGPNTYATFTLTAVGRTFLGAVDLVAQRAALQITDIALITLPGNTTTFLRGDGTFATPAGGGGGVSLSASLSSMNGAASVPADRFWYSSGVDTFALGTISANGRSLIGGADYAAMRTQLGLVVGTNVQAYNARLTSIANLSMANETSIWVNGAGTLAAYQLSLYMVSLAASEDLSTLLNALTIGSVASLSLRTDGSFPVPTTLNITASESLVAGNIVNLHSSGGNARVRKANASTAGSEANGFVLEDVVSGDPALVYKPGDVISGLSGLTADASYFLSTTGGGLTVTPPSATGNVVQYVGRALSTTTLYFFPHTPITVS